MRIRPPCSSTSDFAIARPSPEPWWLLVSWLSTCSNGRPSFLSADGGMPMPLSTIAITTDWPRILPRTLTRPPSGVNFTAFDRRLSKIEAGRLQPLAVELQAAGLDLRHIEHVVDHLEQI